MIKYIVQDPITTGRLIKTRRVEIGLSQAEMAYVTGLSISALQSWEYGRRSPSPRLIPRLLQILHVTAADLAIDVLEVTPEEPTAPGEIEHTVARGSGPVSVGSIVLHELTEDDKEEPFYGLLSCYDALNRDGKEMLLQLAEMLRTHPRYSAGQAPKD